MIVIIARIIVNVRYLKDVLNEDAIFFYWSLVLKYWLLSLVARFIECFIVKTMKHIFKKISF